jgi:hypothetical protein
MAAFPEGGGVVIFIFLSRENPVKFTDPDGKDTRLARPLLEETPKIVNQIPPGAGSVISTGMIKMGGWGIIALFLMSLQSDSAIPPLPANYINTSKGIMAPNGALIATTDQAWKHANGLDNWNIIDGWGKGSYNSANASLLDHYDRHGAGVGAFSPLQYLYKAKEFAKNLKRARFVGFVEGETPGVKRWVKNGRYT